MENASFNPLIFACTGGARPTATKVIKRLAAKLCERRNESYADSITFIKTKVRFALLHSSILCIRGCRSARPNVENLFRKAL